MVISSFKVLKRPDQQYLQFSIVPLMLVELPGFQAFNLDLIPFNSRWKKDRYFIIQLSHDVSSLVMKIKSCSYYVNVKKINTFLSVIIVVLFIPCIETTS